MIGYDICQLTMPSCILLICRKWSLPTCRTPSQTLVGRSLGLPVRHPIWTNLTSRCHMTWRAVIRRSAHSRRLWKNHHLKWLIKNMHEEVLYISRRPTGLILSGTDSVSLYGSQQDYICHRPDIWPQIPFINLTNFPWNNIVLAWNDLSAVCEQLIPNWWQAISWWWEINRRCPEAELISNRSLQRDFYCELRVTWCRRFA